MVYEIAGGVGVKMARGPDAEVFVLVGDGSYLMMNSEIVTSVQLGQKLIIVLLDNHGYGCIHRLQGATVGDEFNNLLAVGDVPPPAIDFVAHARAMGAQAEKVAGLAQLPAALERAMAAKRTSVVLIETDPEKSTQAGGAWWDVPVAEISTSEKTTAARKKYEEQRTRQRTS
jgi:3D-(3,5/4)-trihydroxycyclohexane-1,2-dione acylhydrolase (decyclizing)